MGYGIFAISVFTSIQAATRLFAPYGWGWLSDHTGERVKLLRYGATVALITALGLWWDLSAIWLGVVLLIMFTHTSAMMPMSEAAMAHLVSQGGSFDAKRYGRVRLFGSLGFLVTVLLAGVWFERFGMKHFPAWTIFTLLAVVVSVWYLPNLKASTRAMVFCCFVFSCVVAHWHLRFFLAVSGLIGLQQSHHWHLVGSVCGG